MFARSVAMVGLIGAVSVLPLSARATEPLSIAVFQVDVTPPLGSPLCNANVPPAVKVVDPLTARGIVLIGSDKPIILCTVDWVGVGNGGYTAWRTALADAAGTTIDRVAVHTVHQHDAPGCDFTVEEILSTHGLAGAAFSVGFAREAIGRTGAAVRRAIADPAPVTHIGLGKAQVDRIASNRRILGPDGKVTFFRRSFCDDPAGIAAPEGVIDPQLRLVSFWNGDRPIASLTWYACHPQSFYGLGAVSADFVGLARGLREATLPNVAHIHFTGASGNVAAGKYNDGTPGRRFELAGRLADAMARAWDAMEKQPVSAHDLRWTVRHVHFAPRAGFTEEQFLKTIDDKNATTKERVLAARNLAWLQRMEKGGAVDVTCLRIGKAHVVSLPGEPFVEYQLMAAKIRPDAFICTAGYGDFGPGYIGTAVAYQEGGYETGLVSRVGPDAEPVVKDAMRDLLK
jgi:hypothetical protein